MQRDIEQLHAIMERKQKYARYNETFRGRNSFSKTDPDATFMHMKEDHMRNAQLKPGYNVQCGVEGEYITGVLVSPERSDQLTLIPLLEKMQGYGADYADVTADAGYESEENYSWFEAAEYVAQSGTKRPFRQGLQRGKILTKLYFSLSFLGIFERKHVFFVGSLHFFCPGY